MRYGGNGLRLGKNVPCCAIVPILRTCVRSEEQPPRYGCRRPVCRQVDDDYACQCAQFGTPRTEIVSPFSKIRLPKPSVSDSSWVFGPGIIGGVTLEGRTACW